MAGPGNGHRARHTIGPRGIDATVARPVNIGLQDMATPEAKQGMLLSVLLPYLLILTSFIGGAYLILDATAGERER